MAILVIEFPWEGYKIFGQKININTFLVSLAWKLDSPYCHELPGQGKIYEESQKRLDKMGKLLTLIMKEKENVIRKEEAENKIYEGNIFLYM